MLFGRVLLRRCPCLAWCAMSPMWSAIVDWAAFVDELAEARGAVAGLPLGAEFHGDRHGTMTLRWAYVHMISEYAQHNGHADLLRERIDGTAGI